MLSLSEVCGELGGGRSSLTLPNSAFLQIQQTFPLSHLMLQFMLMHVRFLIISLLFLGQLFTLPVDSAATITHIMFFLERGSLFCINVMYSIYIRKNVDQCIYENFSPQFKSFLCISFSGHLGRSSKESRGTPQAD